MVPLVAISCSSTNVTNSNNESIKEKGSNISGTGIPFSTNLVPSLSVEINPNNSIGESGLYTNISNYSMLSNYLIIKNIDTQQSIADDTLVKISGVTIHDNITSQTIDLGILGKIIGTYSNQSWNFQFYKIFIPKNVKELKNFINVDMPASLDEYSININADTNWSLKENVNKVVYQYIWLYKPIKQGQFNSLNFDGAIIGTYKLISNNSNGPLFGWTWEYNKNQLPIYQNSEVKITSTGIPLQSNSTNSNLKYLSKYLTIPFLYQFSNSAISTNQVFIYPVTVAKDVPTIQKIEVANLGLFTYNWYAPYIMSITGTYVNGSWQYTFELINSNSGQNAL